MAAYKMPTAKQFVEHFKEWLYYEEKKNADPKYLDTLHGNAGKNNFTRWQPLAGAGNGDQWCGYTVDGVAVEVCGSIAAAEYLLCQPQKPYMSGYTPDMEQWYKDAGRYRLIPEYGDQAFFYIASKGRTGHTGTVISVDKAKKTFCAIEGNTSSTHYDDNGGCIAIHKYSYADAGKKGERVRGFGRPRFAEEEKEPEMDYEAIVKAAYPAVLNREADADGLKTWVDALKSGMPVEKVLAGLKWSEEGKANDQKLRESTTRLAYYMLLGRPARENEIKEWVNATKDGELIPVEKIWQKIASSDEAKNK